VGVDGDTTIEALKADGSTYSGSAVLKISVLRNEGLPSSSAYTRCFAYRFGHQLDDRTPHGLASCPAGRPLSLPPPTAPVGVSDRTAQLVRQTITALPVAERNDAATIRSKLAAVLGTSYQISVEMASGGVSVRVNSGDQCLSAVVRSDGEVTVGKPVHGTSCQGG
jgi:hypothetical protein